MGLQQGVLCVLDRESGRCDEVFQNLRGDPSSLTACRSVKCIAEDRDDPQILWIGTVEGGLDRLDKRTRSFTHFEHVESDPGSLGHGTVI